MSKLNNLPASAAASNEQLAARRRELESLIAPFAANCQLLGNFEYCAIEQLPATYANLLAHTSHMTVTVEKRHGCSVDVEVLQSKRDGEHYCREILLRRQSDHRVVQYGIVRLLIRSIGPDVFREILAEQTPLGRVLINHQIMTHVGLLGLWRVNCGERLAALLSVPPGQYTFGRTALIYCDREAAVELLEIVAPEETFDLPSK